MEKRRKILILVFVAVLICVIAIFFCVRADVKLFRQILHKEDTLLEKDSYFLPTDCVYVSPISSYVPVNGDTGYGYYMDGDSMTLILKQDNTPQAILIPLDTEWQKLSKEQWESYFEILSFAPAFQENEMELLKVSGKYHLIRDNQGEYLLVCLWGNNEAQFIIQLKEAKKPEI